MAGVTSKPASAAPKTKTEAQTALANGQIDVDEYTSIIERLAVAKQTAADFNLKIGNTGCVSLYFGRRFPVNCFASDLPIIFANQAKIEKFVADNAKRIEALTATRKAELKAERAAKRNGNGRE